MVRQQALQSVEALPAIARQREHLEAVVRASELQYQAGRRSLLHKLLDLGGFFGVDIGGTLAKVVFFLPDKELATRMLVRLAPQRSRQAEWHAKLHSVHQLAGFILSNDRYGATGVREKSHRPESLMPVCFVVQPSSNCSVG